MVANIVNIVNIFNTFNIFIIDKIVVKIVDIESPDIYRITTKWSIFRMAANDRTILSVVHNSFDYDDNFLMYHL